MGFRSLAIQKRSSEVWKVLGAVKSELGRFGDLLDKAGKQLQTTQNTLELAASKNRNIQNKLKSVEDLPKAEALMLLGETHLEQDATQEIPTA